jgi:hypothetical protein
MPRTTVVLTNKIKIGNQPTPLPGGAGAEE